jgi:hypothetical protein
MLKEFREFAMRGNVLDMAIGSCTNGEALPVLSIDDPAGRRALSELHI